MCSHRCSGDGTLRKARSAWERRGWKPTNGASLHPLQVWVASGLPEGGQPRLITRPSLRAAAPQPPLPLAHLSPPWLLRVPCRSHRRRRQLAIARRGLELLRPGGTLVYSTCSLNPLENEAVGRP
eukprot:SAG25_NODE_2537_length_1545_cov_1.140387_1_plen_125_part_00